MPHLYISYLMPLLYINYLMPHLYISYLIPFLLVILSSQYTRFCDNNWYYCQFKYEDKVFTVLEGNLECFVDLALIKLWGYSWNRQKK